MAKTIKTRIVQKHATEEDWQKATSFAPLQGELIVYDPDSTYAYPRFKVGDGSTLVNNLPFVDEETIAKINALSASNVLATATII